MDKASKVIVSDPDIMSGEPVFTGTRVPVRILFDYLVGGEPLSEFLEDFPSVSREHAVAVIQQFDMTSFREALEDLQVRTILDTVGVQGAIDRMNAEP